MNGEIRPLNSQTVGDAGLGVSWRTPAVWKAVARHGKLLEWRVLADNKPVYEILAGWHPSRKLKALPAVTPP